MKMRVQLQDLVTSSLAVTITIYGAWRLLTEMLYTILPFGIILTIVLGSAIYFLRVPSPDPELVETILGKAPHLIEDNSNNEQFVMKTIAHRGAGFDAPENSLVAFEMCKDKGCNAIEFDITLTLDEIPIVFHDSTLERMSNCDFAVGSQKWENLANIDISVKHPFKNRFTTTNIPTLEQTVIQLLACGQKMFIDIKDNNRKMVKVIHDLYEKYPDLYTKAVVSSFYPQLIYFIRRSDPKIVCSLAWRPNAFAYESYSFPHGKGVRRSTNALSHYLLCLYDILHEWALPRITYYLLGLSVILMHKDNISGRAIVDWRERGIRVMSWTVNTPIEKQYAARILQVPYLTDTLTGEGTTHTPNF